MRDCPVGPAWADRAYATDKAHSDTECSNAGLCDRASGQCACFPGYTGAACQRAECPNSCSGRGECMTLFDLGKLEGPDYAHPSKGGDGIGPLYSNWDKHSSTACVCHPGYFGPDCSQVMCPKNDDPVTFAQTYRALRIKVGDSTGGAMSGDFRLSFMGFSTTISASGISGRKCRAAVERLKSVDEVRCNVTDTVEGMNLNVTFRKFPLFPVDNNLHSHNGNPPIDMFHCDTSGVTGSQVYCNITDIVAENIREYDFCSGRGICDFTQGICTCSDGFTGIDCSMSSSYKKSTNSQPAAYIEAKGGDYTGVVMSMKSDKSAAIDFKMIEAVAGGNLVFDVRGDGRTQVSELYVTGQGLTIDDGGLYIVEGGQTIEDGKFLVTDDPTDDFVARVKVDSDNFGGSNAQILELLCDDTTSKSDFSFIAAGDGPLSTVFRVRGDGQVYAAGGLEIDDGGATIGDAGLFVKRGGATVADGNVILKTDVEMFMTSSKLTLNGTTDGILVQTTGGSATQAGITIERDSTASSSYTFLEITDTFDTSPSSILTITADPSTTIGAGGLSVTGGLTVTSGGLNIGGGGASVTGTLDGDSATFSGTLTANGITDVSDRRLKEDIASIANRSQNILSLQGVSYKMKTDAEKSRIGFIAQDVQPHFPELVHTDEHGQLSIFYGSFAPLIVEQLKVQDKQIADLQTQVKQLEDTLAKVLKRLDQGSDAK